MDLEVEEVSKLLNIPEEIIIQWIEEGKIPGYSIQDRYRLNREEIEEWVLKQKSLEHTSNAGSERFALYRALNKGDVFLDIQGDTKQDIIHKTMERLAPSLKLDPEVLTDLFMERENLMSTSLGSGFALPHARDLLLYGRFDVVSVVFLQKPINFDALDGKPVHTLFFLLASNNKKHLSLLSKIAHLINTPSMRQKLEKRPTKIELLEIMKEWEENLPEK
jgi:PTS system nitrogen regulatory IIA component